MPKPVQQQQADSGGEHAPSGEEKKKRVSSGKSSPQASPPSSQHKSREKEPASPPPAPAEKQVDSDQHHSIDEVFQLYTAATGHQMDGRSFVKLLRDTGIISAKGFSSTDADLIFTKVKPKGSRKIDFHSFEKGLEMVAQRKQTSKEELIQLISHSSGPILQCTKPDAVKFHDDKSLYTGVHLHGGPSTVDTGRTAFADLSSVTDRSAYTIRGVGQKVAEQVAKQSGSKH